MSQFMWHLSNIVTVDCILFIDLNGRFKINHFHFLNENVYKLFQDFRPVLFSPKLPNTHTCNMTVIVGTSFASLTRDSAY